MHIVQCYELEEKSAEGYFKGVLRDTTTIGRWTLEVTSNETSLLRLAEDRRQSGLLCRIFP